MTLSSKSRHSKPPTIRIPVQSCIEQGFVIEFVEAVMKVIVKGRENRDQLEIFSIEGFVPADHLLRKIDSAVDFNHIYDIVEDLYCADNGRPSIDPVVIFKMVLIQHLYGLPSLRRTVEEIKMNVAYRWFLGYLMNEQIPHFSTVSYNFKHRYTEKTIEEIFYWILNEIETAGYLSPEAVFVDGTHIKANANLKKAVKKAVPQAAKIYEKQLMEEINEERNDHGKKPFDETKPPEEKEISESTTDPESGVFHKGEHKKCFAYTAQTCCDKNGYVMDVTVNPGNVHDSVAFDGLYDRLVERNTEIKAIVAEIDNERIDGVIACFSKTDEDIIDNCTARIRNIKRNELYYDTEDFVRILKSLRTAEKRRPCRNSNRPKHCL